MTRSTSDWWEEGLLIDDPANMLNADSSNDGCSSNLITLRHRAQDKTHCCFCRFRVGYIVRLLVIEIFLKALMDLFESY